MSARNEQGSAAVEIVILTPVLVILMLFVISVGRAGGAVEQVRHAADTAARAASLVSNRMMQDIAERTVAGDLDANGATCSSVSVVVAFSDDLVDTVTVTVTCAVRTDGATLLGALARTVSASSTEVVDRYRGG